MDTGNEPASEVDMFVVNVSDGDEEEEGDVCGGVSSVPSSSLSRNSHVMDESLDRHIEMMTEKLLAADPEPAVSEDSGGSRTQRSKKRKLGDVQQSKRVTRQKK
jgi:hypothetical protein